LVHRQPGLSTHPDSRIQHVDACGVLHVEPVQLSRGAHARHGPTTHENVERRQAPQQVWLRRGVNAVPPANQTAVADLDVELLTSQQPQGGFAVLRGG